jgi:hypothetical protein
MSLIHLLNEVVSQRELGAQSWSTYISFSLNESTGAIIAETFSIYHNAKRPSESYRRRVGEQRVSYNKAPLSVSQQLRLLADIATPQPRDTIDYDPHLLLAARDAGPAAPVPLNLPA